MDLRMMLIQHNTISLTNQVDPKNMKPTLI